MHELTTKSIFNYLYSILAHQLIAIGILVSVYTRVFVYVLLYCVDAGVINSQTSYPCIYHQRLAYDQR